MRTLFVWLGAVITTLVIISPFFWLWFLKKKNKWLYITVSSIISIAIMIFYGLKGYDLLLDYMAMLSADAYYFSYDAGSWTPFIFAFLMFISPFIFTKILYGKITVKSFFISLASSILILTILFLIFAYYIVPKAFEGFLLNI